MYAFRALKYEIERYWEGVQTVQAQLTDPVRVEEIYQTMMLPLWEATPPDDRYYESRRAGLENMRAYLDGTYSVFNRAHTLAPLSEKAEPEPTTPELPIMEAVPDNPEPNAELEEAKERINGYCMEVFEQEADYSDLSHVDLAFSATADSAHIDAGFYGNDYTAEKGGLNR